MSILLSAYFPEGIIFSADKNATIILETSTRSHRWVEPTLTKVLSWPNQRAAVGYVGVANLAGLQMDEWLRVFIAGTRDFRSLDELATELRDRVQADFRNDHGPDADLACLQLVLHLGGFAQRNGTVVPVMYHVWNHWQSLNVVRSAGFTDQANGLEARAAYCKMAV